MVSFRGQPSNINVKHLIIIAGMVNIVSAVVAIYLIISSSTLGLCLTNLFPVFATG